MMADYTTVFGSLANFRKGGVDIIDDDPKNYVFSNVFEVAAAAAAYERVAVGKNFEYVIEAMRADGISPWFTCAHDEFVLCMDGRIEVHLVKLAKPVAPAGSTGAVQLQDNPDGRKMGRVIIGRGHMALLPAGSAYRFQSETPSVAMIQTIQGAVTVEKWAQICQTA
jgi:hypothetical protein